MNIAHGIRIALIVLLVALVAAIVYGIVKHPLIAAALFVTLQGVGMWWAWRELTKESITGFQRLWMTVAWPVTALAGLMGHVQ